MEKEKPNKWRFEDKDLDILEVIALILVFIGIFVSISLFVLNIVK